MPIQIMIVDDHEIVRAGLTTLLEKVPDFCVIGEASSPAEAIAKANLLQPDIIIMDIRMPGGSGIEACREILSRHPRIKVLMLTSHSDQEAIYSSIIAGAKGYILKEIGSDAFVDVIYKISEGKSLLDPGITQQVFDMLKGKSKTTGDPDIIANQLTSQEELILKLVAQGKTNKEIARELYLSENTIRNYISSMLGKLKLTNRSQAAAYATRVYFKQ